MAAKVSSGPPGPGLPATPQLLPQVYMQSDVWSCLYLDARTQKVQKKAIPHPHPHNFFFFFVYNFYLDDVHYQLYPGRCTVGLLENVFFSPATTDSIA